MGTRNALIGTIRGPLKGAQVTWSCRQGRTRTFITTEADDIAVTVVSPYSLAVFGCPHMHSSLPALQIKGTWCCLTLASSSALGQGMRAQDPVQSCTLRLIETSPRRAFRPHFSRQKSSVLGRLVAASSFPHEPLCLLQKNLAFSSQLPLPIRPSSGLGHSFPEALSLSNLLGALPVSIFPGLLSCL